MSQTLGRNLLHIVFSTKHCRPLIDDGIEDRLFAYLGGTCKTMGCTPLQVGGHLDHVHLAVDLSRRIALSKFLEEIKTASSKWIKTVDSRFSGFYWQNGYSYFPVEEQRLDTLLQYISGQKEHHRMVSYQEECRTLFREHGIVWDEQYCWD